METNQLSWVSTYLHAGGIEKLYKNPFGHDHHEVDRCPDEYFGGQAMPVENEGEWQE